MHQALSTSAPATWHSHPLLPAVVLLLGLALSAGVALKAQDAVQQGAEAEFQRDTLRIANEVNRLIQKPISGLNGFKSLYAARPTLKRAEFRAAVEARNIAQEFPGVRGFGFVEQLTRAQLDAFVAAQRADGAPQFASRQLIDKEKPDLFVVKFVEPASGNAGARGLDIGSEPQRRSTVQKAVDTGQPVMSNAIMLVQDAQKSPGVVMFLPVYAQGSDPNNAQERRDALVGLVFAPMVIHELLANVSATTGSALDFQLQPPEGALLYASTQPTGMAPGKAAQPRFVNSQTVSLGGREFTLRTTSTPAFESRIDFARPWWVFAAGAFLCGLLAFVVRQLSVGQRRAELLATEMTAQLRYDEERAHDFYQCAADWSWETNAQHCFSYVSDNFAQVYGLASHRVLGKQRQDLWAYAATDLPASASDYLAQAQAQLPFTNFEYPVHSKNGGVIWVSVTGRPYFDLDGRFLGHRGIGTDNTVRKAAEQELQLHRQQLEKLVEIRTADLQQSNELSNWALSELKQQKFVLDQHASVLITDVAGCITYANSKFCELTGYSQEELIGKNPEMLNSGQHPKGFFKAMFETISRGEVWHEEVCSRAKDGNLVWTDMTVVAFRGADGKPQSYIAVRTDISKRKRAEIDAQAASIAKSAFLANMSHEIRTPMNGVVGMVDVLQETNLTPEQNRIVGIIHQSSLSLLTILNDILDLSKIEAGKLAIESLPISVRAICEEIVQFMGIGSKTAAVEISLFVEPELPHSILMDTTRLRQVLINLLGNAIKFSDPKSGHTSHVRLSVTPCNLLGDRPGIRFTVVDNGIGISAQALSTLFQPFKQADESTARKFGGTGLGLSITHRLVVLMGGYISVQSTLGEGSEFVAELPLQEVMPGNRAVFDSRIDGVQVLAVTRDAFTAEVIRSYCSRAGAQVQVVADLASAQRTLSSPQPERAATVLLLDIDSNAELPAGVGVVWLTRKIQDALGKELRVSVLPLLYAELIRCVAIASGLMEVPMAYPMQLEGGFAPRSEVPTVEEAQRSGRLILLAEDNETNREVMQEQLRLLGYACEVAEDGLVALEMWRTGRFALLLTDCHMPNMDGFGLTAAIRAAERKGQHLPIVAVTANTMKGQAERCLQQGMDDFLSKPLRLMELNRIVAKWLPLAAPLSEPEADRPIPASVMAIWDATVLSEMTGDNPPLHRRLLEKFLLNSETQVATLAVSTDAGEFAAVADLAHALKSASRMVGALYLGELCEQLETAGSDSDGPVCHRLKAGLAQAFDQSRVRALEHLEGLEL